MVNTENETHTESAAYARGVEVGKSETKPENPYPEGSVEAKAFEQGCADGQKIRSDEKPPVGT